eukprot:8942608-Lingulodinium_polyedra.AAC.1
MPLSGTVVTPFHVAEFSQVVDCAIWRMATGLAASRGAVCATSGVRARREFFCFPVTFSGTAFAASLPRQ